MQTQVNTMVFIGLACLALVVIAIVGTAYLRSISEKRRSAAAIKSLLDMMAENRSINSTVYTMEPGVYAASTATSYQPPHQNTVGNSAENYVILILQVFCLDKKRCSQEKFVLVLSYFKQFDFCSLVTTETESLVQCTTVVHAPF